MTTEELLKPRYKVIADWPNRKDFDIGQIITVAEVWNPGYLMYTIEDYQGKREYLQDFFDKYPHLFESLEWWERREESDMPEYVKFTQAVSGFKKNSVFKWSRWLSADFDSYMIEFDTGEDSKFHHAAIGGGDYISPATQPEYDQYIKSKQ